MGHDPAADRTVCLLHCATRVLAEAHGANAGPATDPANRRHVLLESSHQSPVLVEGLAQFQPRQLLHKARVGDGEIVLEAEAMRSESLETLAAINGTQVSKLTAPFPR